MAKSAEVQADAAAGYAASRVLPFGGSTADLPSAQIAVGQAFAAGSEMRSTLRRN